MGFNLLCAGALVLSLWLDRAEIRQRTVVWTDRASLLSLHTAISRESRRMTQPGDLILSPEPLHILLTGRQLAVSEPYAFTLLASWGAWDDQPLVSALHTRQIALVVMRTHVRTGRPSHLYTPAMVAAVLDNYNVAWGTGPWDFWVPKLRPPQPRTP